MSTVQPSTDTNAPLSPATFDESAFRAQLAVMLSMQDGMNRVVFADWAERRLAWHRAIYVEAAEFLEHLGAWKWWKKGSPDMRQACMELIDIWHFGLSWYIERFGQPVDSEALETAITRRVKAALGSMPASNRSNGSDAEVAPLDIDEIHRQVDRLVAQAGNRLFDTEAFVRLVFACGMSFDDLFAGYVGKNMLNRFRQMNGYKTGTYIKIWGEHEDNVHLDEIVVSIRGVPAQELGDRVMIALAERYAAVRIAQAISQ
jgi:hypothetical protein